MNSMEIPKELAKICEQVEALADRIGGDLSSRTEQPSGVEAVATYMFVKGYKSYRAARLLFENGYWQDAASLTRTLLELALQAKWFSSDPSQATDLFVTAEMRDRLKLLRNVSRGATDDSDGREIREAADSLFRMMSDTTKVDLSWRNWWSDDGNVERLAGEVGMKRVYELQYRQLCWFVHSSPFSINYYDLALDLGEADPGPKHLEFAELLFSSAPANLMEVLAVTDTIFNLNRQKEFDAIGQLLLNYAASSEI
jgi:hypothetical protein